MNERIKILAKAFRLLWRKALFRLSLVAVLACADGFMPVLNVMLMKQVIDTMMGPGLAARPVAFVALVVAWLAAMAAQYLIASSATYHIELTRERACKRLSLGIVDKSLSLKGVARFEDQGFHELSQWLNYVDVPVGSFLFQANDLIKYTVQFISVFAVFTTLEWWVPLALAVSLVPGVMAARANAAAKAKQDEDVNEFERRTRYFRGVMVSPSAAKELRLFSLDRLFRKKNAELFDHVERTKVGYQRVLLRSELVGTIFRVLAVGGVFLALALRARDGLLSAGALALFLQAIFQFSSSLLSMIATAAGMNYPYEFFSRLFGFLALSDTLDLSRSTRHLDGPIQSIRFEEVSFSYPSGVQALNKVSFNLGPGDALALVGENGAGKSTVVKLLARLYEPSSGAIYLNGVDLREYDLASYRSRLSAVFQDFMKYELTLAENVFADGPYAALADSGLPKLLPDTLLDTLPEGQSSLLGSQFGGRELSGGQWQRVAILRGLAKPHELLIVDEPTASIDPIEEASVFKTLLDRPSRMSLIVTHRLGSIRQATRILVLKEGRALAQGSHAELLASCAHYEELYRSQAGLYKEPDTAAV